MPDDRQALIALACLVEPGAATVAQLVAEAGPAGALDRLLPELVATRPGAVGRLLPDDVAPMLAEMSRRGVRVVVRGDGEYPTQLDDLPEPPLALWVRGPLDLRAAALRSVAMVGARACTPYGERVAGDLGADLADSGWAVVSGGAFGIDAAAHRGALSADGPTVAVMACGIDLAYPRAHGPLLSRIADTGLVVGELPPGSLPLRFRFLSRNRLIAALTRGTVVVEAALRSGAMATANRALALSRAVMAVPGPVTSMASAGTNRLLHEQSARAVCSAAEVIELVLGAGADPHPPGPFGPPPDGPPDLSPAAAEVLAALPARRAVPLERLSDQLRIPEVQCLALLGLLELQGLARRVDGGWRGPG